MKKIGLYLRLFIESAVFAVQALMLNKLRSFLSILGITIGIFAIIMVLSITNSLEKNIKDSINSLGTDVVYIQKWPWGAGDGGEYKWWKYMNRPVPKVKELQALEKVFAGTNTIRGMAFTYTAGGKTMKYFDENVSNVGVFAVSHDYYNINNFDLTFGRYFSDFESKSGVAAVIIGYNIYEGLFDEDEDPIGKDVTLLGRKVRVVGVIEKQGESILEIGMDDKVIVPINWIQRIMTINSNRGNPMIMVRASEDASMDELENELKGKMRSVRRLRPSEDDNFALNRITMISSQLDKVFWSVNIGGFIIGIFSVLVGGFGIANIMFVSVKERTNQIGIQKSLGAHNSFILIQFLTEAVVLCLIGGLIGVMIVFGLTALASQAVDFKLYLSFENFILGTGMSLAIGVISGFVPAWQASRLDPVEAIRAKI
jgi:putative ABC transport system permease protein